jgi:site-specific recombinase XerD
MQKVKTKHGVVVVGVAPGAITAPSTFKNNPVVDCFGMVLSGLDSEHSKRAYRRALEEFHRWWFHTTGKMGGPGGPVDYDVVAQWRAGLVADGRLSPQSINQRLAAIRALVRALAIRKHISFETAAAICAIKSVKAAGVRVGTWLSAIEVEKLLRVPDLTKPAGVRNAAILQLMLCCGLRRADVVGLRGRDLQMLEGRWALVNITGKGRRVGTIPVASWAADAIHKWWTVRDLLMVEAAAGVGAGAGNAGAGAINDTGSLPMFTPTKLDRLTQHLAVQTIAAIVEDCGRAIDRPNLRAHDLRRTFAKQCELAGASLHELQMSLRHADISTTGRYLGADQNMHNAPCDVLKWDVPVIGLDAVEIPARRGVDNGA